MKDWTGNKASTWSTLAANNHSDVERETHDFYATDPHALQIFLDKIKEDNIKLNSSVWECACGNGNLSKVLIDNGYNVTSTDLVERGFGVGGVDFLNVTIPFSGDILTNPPYKFAKEFVEKALELVYEGNYVIMFLKIQFLEGKSRKDFFKKYPPKYVYVNSERQKCAINGDFSVVNSSAVCYCWFIWQKGFTGETIIRWI